MKKNKLLLTLLIFIFFMMSNVNAAILTHPASKITYEGVTIFDKKIDEKAAFCLSGVFTPAATSGTVCTSKNSLLELNQRLMIGEIIAQNCTGTETECYVTREVAILSYLGEDIGSPTTLLTDKMNALKNAATSSSNENIYNSNFEISLIDVATNKPATNLNFDIEGDYYKSQTLKISANYLNGETQKSVTGVSGAVIEGNDSSFYIKIPISNVNRSLTISLKVDAKQESYNIAELYTCGEDVQDIAKLENVQRSATKSLNGTVVPKGKLTIIKLDDDGETKLQGANLKLVDADGNTINSCPDERSKSFLCEWTSSQSDKVIDGLPAGTYYLVEESAPKGYNLLKDKIKIEISAIGEVKVDGEVSNDGIVRLYNTLTRTEISKISTSTGKELSGATLQILDEEEKEISCKIIDSNGNQKTLDKCTWVSGEETTIVVGLVSGEYYLVEKIAPEGYELNEEKIKFEIKSDGTTTKVEMKNNLIIKVPDTLSSRSVLLIAISMFDIALGIGIVTYVKKNKVKE